MSDDPVALAATRVVTVAGQLTSNSAHCCTDSRAIDRLPEPSSTAQVREASVVHGGRSWKRSMLCRPRGSADPPEVTLVDPAWRLAPARLATCRVPPWTTEPRPVQSTTVGSVDGRNRYSSGALFEVAARRDNAGRRGGATGRHSCAAPSRVASLLPSGTISRVASLLPSGTSLWSTSTTPPRTARLLAGWHPCQLPSVRRRRSRAADRPKGSTTRSSWRSVTNTTPSAARSLTTNVIGQPEGCSSGGQRRSVPGVAPAAHDYVLSMPRGAQVHLPKDAAPDHP